MIVHLKHTIAELKLQVFEGIDYPESSKFQLVFIKLKIKLFVCRNLCQNFRQIGQKKKNL